MNIVLYLMLRIRLINNLNYIKLMIYIFLYYYYFFFVKKSCQIINPFVLKIYLVSTHLTCLYIYIYIIQEVKKNHFKNLLMFYFFLAVHVKKIIKAHTLT